MQGELLILIKRRLQRLNFLNTEKMSYVLDLIIDSLKAGVPIKYNNFFQIMKDTKDPVANESIKNLGKIAT